MKRYICQDCGHQAIAAQKPSACEVCNGTILLPFEGKKKPREQSDKPRTMIDVSGFGVKKKVTQTPPLPPLPPPPPSHTSRGHSPTYTPSRSRQASHTHSPNASPSPPSPPTKRPKSPSISGKSEYTPGSFDSAMMNIASKPSVHLDSSLLASPHQSANVYKHPQHRSKKSFSLPFSIPVKGVFLGILTLLTVMLLGSGIFWIYRWLINPVNPKSFHKVVLNDNFSVRRKWSLTNGARIRNGGLFQRQPQMKHFGASIWAGRTFTNVDFSADVKKISGPDNVPYGLVTRIGGKNYQDFYYLFISGNGTWVMGKHTAQGWKQRGKWRKSEWIKSGNQQTNRLKIIVKDDLIVGYINGKRVGFFRDKSFKSGKIAVMSMRGTGEVLSVSFDNVVAKIEKNP